jgi:hypothetical protein
MNFKELSVTSDSSPPHSSPIVYLAYLGLYLRTQHHASKSYWKQGFSLAGRLVAPSL